ncbi:MAG: hypothetical protein COA92_01085 [Sulfurovum sp.]|nr:MAG: hypothetical protein COA92_01085 [Sulfurovum sp.]
MEKEKMYKVHIENECNCFKKSSFENNLTYKDKADAQMKAKVMECRMNQEFCHTHYFEAEDMGDEIILRSVVRADFEDEEDDY